MCPPAFQPQCVGFARGRTAVRPYESSVSSDLLVKSKVAWGSSAEA